MANIPDLGTKDPVSQKMPARGASNGMPPGTKGQLLKGGGAVGGAQEAHHKPTKVPHPQGPFVGRDGQRFKVDSQ